MKATGSTAKDNISVKSIKEARNQLEPLLLNLVNRTIESGQFPEEIKTTKVVISHAHHGGVGGKSTQTLVLEVYDKLLQNKHQEIETALILLDQSKVYDMVQHTILLGKLKLLGMKGKSLGLMETFLKDRKQYVQLQGFDSQDLLIRPQSVVQGNTLSCLLFLLYILDSPVLFHDTRHQPLHQRTCTQPTLETYIDDNYIITTKSNFTTIKESIQDIMKKVGEYTSANRLALSKDKTQIMLISKDKNLKQNFKINLSGKEVKHRNNVKILGNMLDENLSWEGQLKKILIPSLSNRIRTLKAINKFLNPKFRKQYTNAVFRSKMFFGAETWGGPSPQSQKFRNSKTRQQNWQSIPKTKTSQTDKFKQN